MTTGDAAFVIFFFILVFIGMMLHTNRLAEKIDSLQEDVTTLIQMQAR